MLDMQTIGYLNYMQEEENKRKEKKSSKKLMQKKITKWREKQPPQRENKIKAAAIPKYTPH